MPRHVLEVYAARFLGDAAPTHPLVSAIHAELAGLPPLLVQAGGAETLLDDARRLHERARAHGVEATLSVYPDMIHAFMVFEGLPDAAAAVDELVRHLRAHIG